MLWLYTTPLPNSSDVLNLFRKLGKRVFYVTNNSTKTRDEFVEKSNSLKFEACKDDIICTANLAARYLQSKAFTKKVYVIGSEGKIYFCKLVILRNICYYNCLISTSTFINTAVAKELELANISYCGIGPDVFNEDILYNCDKDPDISAVIVAFDKHFSYRKILKATMYLNDPNVHFIGTNTDEKYPIDNDLIPGIY